MGEELPALPTNEPANASISHNRLLIEMAILIALGAIVGFIFGGVWFGIGVLVGGGLSFANYFWLKLSTFAIFDRTREGERTSFLPLRFVSRYFMIAVVLSVIYFFDVLPIAAVILGLAAFAFAVVFDGLLSIFMVFTKKDI